VRTTEQHFPDVELPDSISLRGRFAKPLQGLCLPEMGGEDVGKGYLGRRISRLGLLFDSSDISGARGQNVCQRVLGVGERGREETGASCKGP
jgi:hypothetical protein